LLRYAISLLNINSNLKKISVIGSGFSGLSAACSMAKHWHGVTVFEKNEAVGGRARVFHDQGFTFDMGPSWYWMPDVFEKFFAQFGQQPQDYYQLVRLDPGFQVIYGKDEVMQIPADIEGIYELFEQTEKGSAEKLRQFLAEGAYKYRMSMQDLVYKPSLSWLEFANKEVVGGALKLHMFRPISKYIRSFFNDERLVALLEFPVLFLGAMAQQIPALYSLMNYAAFELGTWYPMGGMAEIAKAMEQLATSLGVEFISDCPVHKIQVSAGEATHLETGRGAFRTDGVIATGDYHHTEQQLLDPGYRNYSTAYWDKKIFAPSCLIFYVGVRKKIAKLIHHNLFFDAPFDAHAREIYEDPQWPANPLFYVCCPSKTDPGIAPEGMENLFLLVPLAVGLHDNETIRENYFEVLMQRMEAFCGESIKEHIVYKKSYCIRDFQNDYNAYKGNAYGLANTLRQTAVLKPSMRNKAVMNLFYAGQLTVPGPGVPPALISGQVAAEQMVRHLNSRL